MPKKIIIIINLLFFLAIFPCYQTLAEEAKQAVEYFQTGISWYDQGNYDQAIGAFQRAADMDPNMAEVHYNLGVIYDLQGKFHEAIKAYEIVIQQDPNIGAVWENIAQDCYMVGELRKGMDYIKVAESLGKPVNKELYNQMWREVKGEAGKKGQPNRNILPPLRLTHTVTEDKPQPLQRINRDLELEVIGLEKELELKSGPSDSMINLGIKYRQRGDVAKAIEVFSKAISLNLNKAIIYAELSLCYYFDNKIDLFVQHFAKAKAGGFKPSKSLQDLYLQCAGSKAQN